MGLSNETHSKLINLVTLDLTSVFEYASGHEDHLVFKNVIKNFE